MNRDFLRSALTLALAVLAALAFVSLRAPLPWLVGPLLVTSIASRLFTWTRSAPVLVNAAHCAIGAALGLYFSPLALKLVASLWWAILLAVAWSLSLGWIFARWLHWRHARDMGVDPREARATCWFAGAIGGASEMTLLAEREGGRGDMVAAAHSLRLVIVALSIPFAFGLLGIQGHEQAPPAAGDVHLPGLLVLSFACAAGGLLMRSTGQANPWLLGPFAVSMGMSITGLELSAMPPVFSNGAQLIVGVSLGARFGISGSLRTAPGWLASVAYGTSAMLVLCTGFAALIGWATNLSVATLMLATSPGGAAEMALTAKVLQLGVPVVTAFQVCRLVAALVLAGPLYRWWEGKSA